MRGVRRLLIALAVVAGVLYVPGLVAGAFRDGPSVCRGTTGGGSLTNGALLAGNVEGARAYCWLCVRALRTYGHDRAVVAVRAAYEDVAIDFPETDWVFGEVGFPWGGPFPPHRTHQNGLSFDMMVPLKHGARFPAHLLNRFGYDEEFDHDGRGAAGEIDFDALAAHLVALERQARARGGRIARVIFAPDLQDDLFRTAHGERLRQVLRFNARPSWVRHDDHYHVDFDFPCEPA